MNILIVGSGGREHALAWKLSKSPQVTRLICAPGNPGMASVAELSPVKANDLPGLLALAGRERIDLTVVGPEQPLADGIVDEFERAGMKVFGPTRAGARLEWSKAFAKEFMARHGIPTAQSRTFTQGQHAAAIDYCAGRPLPIVIKADGLAAGKGVLICGSRSDVAAGLRAMFDNRAFGSAGDTVVVEDFLEGREASVFAISDGRRFVLLAPAQDHKRVFDADMGKNTGGMGAFAPTPYVTGALLDRIARDIIRPTLDGMESEGSPYRGCLYVGLMLTTDGPKVIEYNCRFGDPETQVVLPLYTGDLAQLLLDAASGAVDTRAGEQQWSGAAACVVLASGGYPDEYQTGKAIRGLGQAGALRHVSVFHAGTRLEGGAVVSAGGRVLAVTAVDPDGRLPSAIRKAYEAVSMIEFDGMHFRKDIGRSGIILTIQGPE
jgi:phosphoribosylamine--glycine ligase